ncbi:LysR family transcriptional regulator [Caballeronia mineralivorans PML1(12)]|uniref:LysR family transcriptional regulator n=1 Tax=Caballeronia mineralivorans PML1(12) TaxID=908627 RepID=A0A0J1D175_9BURK|nr:LysR substrate-binding domain-containing protein [Caballeronia mineralivorans]KLU26534.1 LysR family transcriptional regulator [Caballeronia mineralivorans PML1(12)]
MNDDSARLRRLFLFDAVCDAGGIGQAAARAGRSQPAVSLAIGKLEASFGVTLFERGYGGSELTTEGAILHRRVKRMLSQIEQTVAELLGGVEMPSRAVSSVCRHLTDAQVRCHIAIAHRGSASEAAQQLGISPPAVHRAARELERTVGMTLYRRRVHSVSANPAGVEFARRLSLALYEIVQAGEELSSARGQLTGRVAIGVLPMLPPRLVARATQRLLRSHPHATVTLQEGSHAALLTDLRFGAIDAIVGALREPRLSGAVIETGLFEDPYVVAVRKGHRLAAQSVISAADLAAFDWVAPQPGMPRRVVIDAMLSRLPRRPRLVVETSSLAMIMAMLMESDCITLLSRSQIRQAYPGDELVALDVATSGAGRTVGLTTRHDWLATEVQEAFLAQLREESLQEVL